MRVHYAEASLSSPKTSTKGNSTPFMLNGSGRYDLTLNQFLGELPTLGARSNHTIKAITNDIAQWGSFLEERKKDLWTADREDLTVWKTARRGSGSTGAVSSATWNRNLLSLDKLYKWALEEGVIDKLPFAYKKVRNFRGQESLKNRALDADARQSNVKFLSPEAYKIFRDVGLRGLKPDGSPDPTFHGRQSERNARFADWCVTTGARLSEASSLCLKELPQLSQDGRRSVPFHLPDAASKRQGGRVVPVSIGILKSLYEYAEVERDTAIGLAHKKSTYSAFKNAIPILEANSRGLKIQRDDKSRVIPWNACDANTRRNAFISKGGKLVEPCLLWVGDAGLPIGPNAWETIFRRANDRCRHYGIDLGVPEVGPHTLRHTFAVWMLSKLIRATFGTINYERNSNAEVYARMVGDPLRTLQQMLGHRSIQSTYIYLTCTNEAQKITDEAIDQWSKEIVG